MPKCLSVQEGDRHVEFNRDALYLAESGTPKKLTLDDGRPVRCEHFEIVRNARLPTVLIEFMTEELGTSLGVSDRKYAVATINGAKWVLKPIVLKRRINDQDQIEITEINRVQWTQDSDRQAVLTVTDVGSKKSKIYRP